MNRKLLFNILKFVVFLSLGVLLAWYVTKDLTQEQRDELRSSFREANYWWIGLAMVIGVLSHILRAVRWKMMLEPLGYHPRTSTTFHSVMIAYLANMAVPRLGEVTRCGIIQRYEKVPFDKAVGTLVVERSIDLVCLVLATALLFLTQFSRINQFFSEKVIQPIGDKLTESANTFFILALVGVVMLVGLWVFIRYFSHTEAYLRLRLLLLNVRDGIYSIRHLKNFKLFLLYTFLIWFCYFTTAWLALYALSETSHMGPNEALAVLVFGTVGIISTPGGIGAYQLIVTETLVALYGLDRTYAISFSWLAWSCQTIMIIFVALISLLAVSRLSRRQQHDQTASDTP
ncbi:MAG TPA: lysylphosphatidylglycerol synthase transmembrane domain-containing protein [Chitinophagales bacterium]|nr:lysylphosphatidylglycerol synthase transmembrane domain-containing protein [Chitinophagales bacterium]